MGSFCCNRDSKIVFPTGNLVSRVPSHRQVGGSAPPAPWSLPCCLVHVTAGGREGGRRVAHAHPFRSCLTAGISHRVTPHFRGLQEMKSFAAVCPLKFLAGFLSLRGSRGAEQCVSATVYPVGHPGSHTRSCSVTASAQSPDLWGAFSRHQGLFTWSQSKLRQVPASPHAVSSPTT